MKQFKAKRSTAAKTDSPLLTGARELANLGLRVFPLHHADALGHCSCRDRACRKIAKHPRITKWQNKATTDRGQIDRWWLKWPEANVGVATGEGLIVADIDGLDGELLAEDLGLPPTAYVTTRRGRHLYYIGDGPTRAGVCSGVDIRGEGGYVVAPPSVHATGVEYRWVVGLDELAEAPEWLTDAPEKPTKDKKTRVTHDDKRPLLEEGERNDHLFRLGSSLRGIGMSEGEIGAALQVANEERCIEPLDRDEVSKIATSVSGFPPSRRIDKTLLTLKLGPYPTTVYLAVRASCNHENRCFRSYEGLAEQTVMGRSTVIKAVKALAEAGLIHIERRPLNQCNVYTLLDPTSGSAGPEAEAGRGCHND
jgi:Bifunctional DNA primase/polymerase, N-terminal/Primase C terminal 1 (PriCT-1)/Helix-turn-helix domain